MAATELFSGERVVVSMFISRVLLSVPPSLFYEAVGLCLLAVAALLLEIAFERSPAAVDRFRTRLGASSGILLGAITLPTVMLSRLIQLSRLLSIHDVGPEEIQHLSMQYWAVGVSCFSVLVFLFLALRHSFNSSSYFHRGIIQEAKFGIFYIIIYVIACSMSLAMKSNEGSLVAVKMLWLLSHGLACVTLIQHILHTFPSCASVGEALLVSSGLAFYFGDLLTYTLAKIDPFLLLSESYFVNGSKSHISTIIQGFLLGLLLLPAFYKFVLHIWDNLSVPIKSKTQVGEGSSSSEFGRSILFYASLAVLLIVIAPLWMEFVQDFHVHPLLWVFVFVITDPLERLLLCVYWVGIICASVVRFYNISKHSRIERILLRKYYHLVAVLMFLPALLLQPKFLDLAFGAALAVFLILEMIRVWKIWPLGHLVHEFMNAFTDHRDSEVLIVSHFSLLLGCALPKWLSLRFNDRPLAPFAGILSLGIGDTMASLVGHKYGVLRWSKSGKKTVEGTAAGITSVLATCSVLLPLMASTSYILSQHWLSLLVAVTVSGLLEAYTAQLDNAFIPLVFYSLLCL
uniref:dolichol kinase n=1 Tax=Anthurium amnicola TaxID=1678845 RepID=A0A1D1XFZ3_9ARAE